MDVNIRTEGAVIQNRTNLDLTNPKSLRIVEGAFQEDIKKRMRTTIQELQEQLDTDIWNFAKEFHHKYPKQWGSVKNRWDEIFPQVIVNVNVKGNIRRQGTINESVKRREERWGKLRWGAFAITTLIIVVIILLQKSQLKKKPKKDKFAFFMLLFIGWMLSLFDLSNMSGPITWVTAIFKPIGQFME